MRRSWLLPAALIAIAVAIRIPLLGGSQIDYDEGAYWASLRSMADGHPLFSSVYSSQPPGFLLVMSPFFAVGHGLASARAGILVFFAIALVAVWSATRLLFGGVVPAIVAVVLLAADPLMLRQSVTLQADGPATALGMAALAAAVAATRSASRRRGLAWCALGGAVLGCAVLVKLLAVVFAVPAILVLFLAPGTARPSLRVSLQRAGVAAVGVIIAMAALLLPFADRMRLVWSEAVGGHVTARTLHEGGLTWDMAVALARESPIYLAALLGGVLLAVRARRVAVVLAAWAIAVAGLALLQRPLWPHHLLVASPLAAMAAAGLAGVRWPAVVGRRLRLGLGVAGGLAVAIAGAVTGLLAINHAFTADTHTTAVAVLQRLTRPGDLILTDDQFAVATAERDTPPELVDTSFVRIDSEPLSDAAIEAIATRDHVSAVYVGTNRLPHIGTLLDWVRLHYPHATQIGDGAVIYTAT